MEWLANNWIIVIAVLAVIVVAVVFIVQFANKKTDEQIAALKEWLLYACMIAEKELGKGTGKAKLRYTFDMFLTRFPWLAQYITFERFSVMVDEVLLELRKLLETNDYIKSFVG